MKTLQELFNSGIKFTETESFGKRVYKWDIEGKKYVMKIEKNPNAETWDVVFTGEDKQGFTTTTATDTGDELKVFSTVVNIMKTFIKKSKPLGLVFFSEGDSRSKLYDRMVKKFATGYDVKKSSIGSKGFMYRLIKK